MFFLKHTEDVVEKTFRELNSGRRNYNFYVFDIIKQEEHIAAQTNSVVIQHQETVAVILSNYTAFVFVLTNRLGNINSDGSQMFELKQSLSVELK